MDYHTPWTRSDRLNLPQIRRGSEGPDAFPSTRDGFIGTRVEQQVKHHCQRQTRLGRSLRIPKHRDGCSTVNRVRSSQPSLTTSVRLGRFRCIPKRRDGCNVQTVQTTDLPNTSRVLSTNPVKPTQPVSVSKARPRASRSSSTVEGRRATDETQRPTTRRVRVP